MGYELIITEKPSSAQKIAVALADGKLKRQSENGVYYYTLEHGGRNIIVVPAVGHLFTVAEKDKSEWKYPVFSVEWVQSSKVDKSSAFSGKYATLIRKLAKDAEVFTVATDYDIEGEVIGYTIVKHLCKQKDANRMKFSTLTKPELRASFNKKASTLNWGQAKAGVTRHELDWYYGINLSRALTLAIRSAGRYKVLSTGRVQGPALKIVVDKEREISAFIPDPYWVVTLKGKLHGHEIEAVHKEDKIFDKKRADEIYAAAKEKDAKVASVDEREFQQKQPFPFDLTTLQTESYRVHNLSPKNTLALAQDLYTAGYISYPRTSSQKLPKTLELDKRIADLKRQPAYKKLAEMLLEKGWTTPNEGSKTDDAHPAIYPTGEVPGELNALQQKVYDLIVKRFLACFADAAKRSTMTVTFDCASEPFLAKGTRTVYKGWHEYYAPYVKLDEEVLPAANQGDLLDDSTLVMDEKETQPPKRYTPASLIKELESRNLGTKATRASIIDNLFDRGYLIEKSIKATPLALHTVDILQKHVGSILDEELTRRFEERLEEIRKGSVTEEEVLAKAREVLGEILAEFKAKQEDIGKELRSATQDAEDMMNRTVPCPACRKDGREGGVLMVKMGKYGRFLGCSNYPDCTFVFRVPSSAKVKASGKIDENTGQELLLVTSGKRRQLVNVDPAATADDKIDESAIPGVDEACPHCEDGKFLLRKSVYGTFLGCSNYPKCKTTRALTKGEDGKYTLGPILHSAAKKKTAKKKTAKKTTKKTTKKTVKKTTKKTAKKAVKKKTTK